MARMLLYVLGAGLMIAGIALLFFETGLDAWVPAGVALAGLIILIGLLVVGLSELAPRAPPADDRTERREGDVVVRR
jgi:hypothetical protein